MLELFRRIFDAHTRTTRLELVLLGFIRNKRDLRRIKEQLLRSNTRNVFVNDDDGELIADVPEIVSLSEEIEARRLARGATATRMDIKETVLLLTRR